MFIINITPEQQREISEHWEKVRAGLHVHQHHDFQPFTKDDVDSALFRSHNEFEKAAFMRRQINDNSS